MRPGMASSLTRDGRTIVLAHDHGLEHGPTGFSEVPERLDPEQIFELATHDAVGCLAVQKGLAETYLPSYPEVDVLLKCNGTSNLWSGEPYSPQTCSVDYAADLGAAAIGYTVYPGSNHEPRMTTEFSEVQEAAREHDLPVALWSYARGQPIKRTRTEDTVAYAARIGLELGADFTKVKYPSSEESLSHAVDAAADVNVLMSGGSKTNDVEFLETVEGAIDAGVCGLAVGRNVWQREEPEAMLDALERVVYEDESASVAAESLAPAAASGDD
ncbi:fructose-bisphosphate aldolase [Salinarchaeum sp. Harcht-Bsk1]|uniref:class I fructose-bisphosphate aldolase n=1 Tax=Salinarchaeum sp. Harcht-Bsk1 TaxID=1333523 RepID=UPI00034231EB|nr:fructose-bisphosphate aldolase [Salinarchaeum sp. Harcht-Bsk1]AGN00106.1 fructose-bisphosphate aldolase [Salinarchaeum sp. Harcht-Bsk1]